MIGKVVVVTGASRGLGQACAQQLAAAGATVEMPVLYFIDPKYVEDIDTKGKTEVTLSYTFFEVGGKVPAAPKGSV